MGFPKQENPRRQFLSQDITTNLFGNSDLLFLKTEFSLLLFNSKIS